MKTEQEEARARIDAVVKTLRDKIVGACGDGFYFLLIVGDVPTGECVVCTPLDASDARSLCEHASTYIDRAGVS